MRIRLVLAAAVAGLGLGLAACGDEEEPDVLTKAQFVQQADVICGESRKQGNAVEEPDSVADLRRYIDDLVPILESQVSALGGLQRRAPEAVKKDFDRQLKLLRQQPGILDDAAKAAGDEARLQTILSRSESLDREADALARKIGLKRCGASD